MSDDPDLQPPSRELTDWNTCQQFGKVMTQFATSQSHDEQWYIRQWSDVQTHIPAETARLAVGITEQFVSQATDGSDSDSDSDLEPVAQLPVPALLSHQQTSSEDSAETLAADSAHSVDALIDTLRPLAAQYAPQTAPVTRTLGRWIQQLSLPLAPHASVMGWSDAQRLADHVITIYTTAVNDSQVTPLTAESAGSAGLTRHSAGFGQAVTSRGDQPSILAETPLQEALANTDLLAPTYFLAYRGVVDSWPAGVDLVPHELIAELIEQTDSVESVRELRTEIARLIQTANTDTESLPESDPSRTLTVQPSVAEIHEELTLSEVVTVAAIADDLTKHFHDGDSAFDRQSYDVDLPGRMTITNTCSSLSSDSREAWSAEALRCAVEWVRNDFSDTPTPYNPRHRASR